MALRGGVDAPGRVRGDELLEDELLVDRGLGAVERVSVGRAAAVRDERGEVEDREAPLRRHGDLRERLPPKKSL